MIATPTATAVPTEPPPAALASAKYIYDGDGAMVKSIVNGVITYYPGRRYNKTVDGASQKVDKYYIFASLTVAIKIIENGTETLKWLLADHLGSTSVSANEDGSWNSLIQYSAFGEIWQSNGATPTDYRYTSQLSQVEIGLYYYNARWYDPALGRFVQADTIVPSAENPTTFDRYAYVVNNPIIGMDSTGHSSERRCTTLIDGENCSIDYGDGNSSAAKNQIVHQPPIVSRDNWGAHTPGSFGLQNDPNMSEGLYPENINGYARYSDLLPGMSLGEIYNTIVIHHEGNWQTNSVLAVQENQMKDGYYDIAYEYAVGSDGTIYEGRDINVRGAHVLKGNTGKVGILLLGDFEPGWVLENGIHIPFDPNGDNQPTIEQVTSTIWLISWLDAKYGIDRVVGHNALNNTVCPGANLLPYLPLFDQFTRK